MLIIRSWRVITTKELVKLQNEQLKAMQEDHSPEEEVVIILVL